MRWDKVLNMLIGEYTHKLDKKNRVSMPSKYRKELGKKLVITRGLDKCLFLYSAKVWKGIAEKLASHSSARSDIRKINRFILAGAIEIEPDTAGRILIPTYLKEFASLKETIVMAGVQNRVEIWNQGEWTKYKNSMTDINKLADNLGDVGAF